MEILVHIAAPGRVVDDRHYRAIAEGVANFEAANLIRISDHDLTSIDDHNLIAEQPNPHVQSSTGHVGDYWLDSGSYMQRSCGNDGHVHKKRRLEDTSEPRRPNTAPESSSATVLVRFTGKEHIPRASSEPVSLENGSTAVLNSQPSPTIKSLAKLVEMSASTSQSCLSRVHFTKRLATSSLPSPVHGKLPKIFIPAVGSVPSERLASRDLNGPVGSNNANSSRFFLENHDLHQNFRTGSLTDASTGMLIERPLSIPWSEGSCLGKSSFVQSETQAVLDSEGCCATNGIPNPQNSYIDTHLLSMPSLLPRHSAFYAHIEEDVMQHMVTIRALAWKIDAPDPSHPQPNFVSSITTRLREIEDNSRIEQWFWPIRVTRDIGVLERGYWRIPITIACSEDVNTWRNLWAGLKHGPIMDKFVYSPWTAEEYFTFFDKMSHSIESNQFGSVSLYKVQSVTVPEMAVPETIQVELRLYGWGEVVAHLYMAMRWASEGRIAHLPLVWIGCDGAAILTMSGERYCWKIPKLGRWVRKNCEGALGTYGIL